MHAALVFQLGIDFFALNGRDDFFHATDRRRGAFQNFDAPALRLCIARVHAEKLPRKKRSFVSTGSRTNFDDYVLLVIWVFGDQQNLEVPFNNLAARVKASHLIVRHLLHLRVVRFGEELPRALKPLVEFFPIAVFGHNIGPLGMRLRKFLVTGRVSENFG